MTLRREVQDAGASVLLTVPDLSSGGGVNRVATDLSRLLNTDLGCTVTLASLRSNRHPTYPAPDGVNLELAGKDRVGPVSYFLELLKLRRRGFHYAVGFWTQDNIMLALTFLFSRTRLVLCEHDSHFARPWHVRLLRRMLYPLAWRVLVLNRAELEHYSAYLRNVHLVPNPLPTPGPTNDETREQLVIGVGHLIPRKGFGDLLRAWDESGLGALGWRLVIIGDGPERAVLEERARLSVNATIVPPTSDLESWYRRALSIVTPSTREVFSLVTAEGALHGAVPLAYAADGPAYLLEDVPELLIRPGDVNGLAEKLRKLAHGLDLKTLNTAVRGSIEVRMSRSQVVQLWRGVLFPHEVC